MHNMTFHAYLSYVIHIFLLINVSVKKIIGSESLTSREENALPQKKTITTRASWEDPERFMKVADIIQYHGYPVEEHSVTTEDGYVLTIQRIPRGKAKYSGERRPVLLQHGLLATSHGWVLNIPENNLPYKLADQGYDVWLGNVRGNSYGKRHLNLSTWDSDFWRFSFHEMGVYDVPAIIDYVLNVTGSRKVNYIGYSMGATILFVTLSTRPEYNDKIREAQIFGAFAANHYACTPLYYGRSLYDYVVPIVSTIEGYELFIFFPLLRFVSSLNSELGCRASPHVEDCVFQMYLLYGLGDVRHMNTSRMPVYSGHFPDSTSFRTVLHMLQLAKNPFQMYDFGPYRNLQEYNQASPPIYNLTQITAPIVIFWSEGDPVVSTLDVALLISKMPNAMQYKMPINFYNHVDFMHHLQNNDILYSKVLEMLDDPALDNQ